MINHIIYYLFYYICFWWLLNVLWVELPLNILIDWFISLSGKGGQKIREIQSESGAYIKVCKKVVTVERMIGYKLKVSCDILLFSLSKLFLYIHAKPKKNLMISEKSLRPLTSYSDQQCHPWIIHSGCKKKGNDHQLKKLLIVEQVLLASTLENV